MGFRNVKAFVDAQVDNGSTVISSIRKTAVGGGAGTWCDLSQGAGTPSANFYATPPLEAAHLTHRNSIWAGSAVSPKTKHLAGSLLVTPSAALVASKLLLCDYLLYYPFIDMDNTEPQEMDNTTAALTRYTDGRGVQAFLVAQGAYVGGASYFMTYTNQDGVPNRTSQVCISNLVTTAGTLISSGNKGVSALQYGCFIPLQDGDTGIRSVQSIQFLSANGGIAALVLCKPIVSTILRELNIPVEQNYLQHKMSLPRIVDGANLNFLVLPSVVAATGILTGILDFAWN